MAIAVLLDDRPFMKIREHIEDRSRGLARGREAIEALRRNGWIVRAGSKVQALDIANALAPEHLVLAVRDARAYLYAVRNAGAVFLGPWSAAAFGDYVAGTNHVLPTAGTARWRGGLGVLDFVKFVAFAEVSRSDARTFAQAVDTLARAEGFEAHAASARSRIEEGIR